MWLRIRYYKGSNPAPTMKEALTTPPSLLLPPAALTFLTPANSSTLPDAPQAETSNLPLIKELPFWVLGATQDSVKGKSADHDVWSLY